MVIILLFSFNTKGFCVTQWDKSLPSSGANLTAWPAAVTAQWSILDTLLANYRQGEFLTFKNTSTITVTSGQVVVSNSGGTVRVFLSDSSNTDLTTANLDSGASFSASTTYYVYAAAAAATSASSTYYISLSSSAPTGPTYYLQLGSFTTDSSGNVPTTMVNNNVLIKNYFGAKVSKSANVAYLAATDGILTDLYQFSSNSSALKITVYSDSSASPSTAIGGADDTNSTNGRGTITIPVNKNNYYQVTDNGSCSHTIYFTPIGN